MLKKAIKRGIRIMKDALVLRKEMFEVRAAVLKEFLQEDDLRKYLGKTGISAGIMVIGIGTSIGIGLIYLGKALKK